MPHAKPPATSEICIAQRDGQPKRQHDGSLDAIRSFIDMHHAERLTLEMLSSLAGLSVFRLVTVFRQRFGVSPYKYLSQVRIEAAKNLLLEGVSPAVVAVEVGFCDQSHLCRHFRSICGQSPGQFVLASLSAKLPSRRSARSPAACGSFQ